MTMTQTTALSHIHRFVDGARERPLLLLHGTGGDESDLVPLGERVAPGAALISPRGQVREGGANRFFRRFAEGVFDVEDLKARTAGLAAFVAEARSAYGLGAPIALGFSNGANIAASLLLSEPDSLAGAILLRGMTPFEATAPAGLAGKPVLMLNGAADPIIPPANAKTLASMLEAGGALVDQRVLPAGHGLTQADVTAVAQWLAQLTSTVA